jgi:hypothetical protein
MNQNNSLHSTNSSGFNNNYYFMAKQPSHNMYNNLDVSPFSITPTQTYTTPNCEQQPMTLNEYDISNNIMQSYDSTIFEPRFNINGNEQNLSQNHQNHAQNVYIVNGITIPGFEITIRPANLNNNLDMHHAPVMPAESFVGPQNNNTIINRIPTKDAYNRNKKVIFKLIYLSFAASNKDDEDKRPIPRKYVYTLIYIYLMFDFFNYFLIINILHKMLELKQ